MPTRIALQIDDTRPFADGHAFGDVGRTIDGNPFTPYWLRAHAMGVAKPLSAYSLNEMAARADIRHFGAELQDFNDTAALCTLMDVVVSVDTSVAHLSAALGKRTWVLSQIRICITIIPCCSKCNNTSCSTSV